MTMPTAHNKRTFTSVVQLVSMRPHCLVSSVPCSARRYNLWCVPSVLRSSHWKSPWYGCSRRWCAACAAWRRTPAPARPPRARRAGRRAGARRRAASMDCIVRCD
jgi:hypothetical protein